MKTTHLLLVFSFYLLVSLTPLQAQHGGHNCGNCPHHRQHATGTQTASCSQQKDQGLATEITAVFPAVKTVKKTVKWTEVYDSKSNLLGYAVYSKPASDGIKGYAGETPLMIALNPKKTIISVTLLDNQETPNFLQIVVNAGLMKSWNGLTPKKAAQKKVDTVSGATYSSRSIIQTLQKAMQSI